MSKAKPFEISARLCMIDNVNLRTEKHGDDEVPAVDVRLTNIMLEKAELIALTGDKESWNLMYVQEKRGSPVEPTLQWSDGWRYLPAKYEACSSKLRFGMLKTEHEFEEHKIKGLAVRAVTGGLTELMLTIQLSLDDTRIMAQLAEYQHREGHAEICFGQVSTNEKKQQKLPLNDVDDDDAEGAAKNRFGTGDQAEATH